MKVERGATIITLEDYDEYEALQYALWHMGRYKVGDYWKKCKQMWEQLTNEKWDL